MRSLQFLVFLTIAVFFSLCAQQAAAAPRRTEATCARPGTAKKASSKVETRARPIATPARPAATNRRSLFAILTSRPVASPASRAVTAHPSATPERPRFLSGLSKLFAPKPVTPRTETGIRPGHTRKVRTTAYTQTEPGGCNNAIGKRLRASGLRSAASDWSRFPVGTKFRIIQTGDTFVIDDYGSALAGTDTIDIYMPTRRSMRAWGVRNVDIAIVEWGSARRSLEILSPRQHNRHVRQMVDSLKSQAKGMPKQFKLRES